MVCFAIVMDINAHSKADIHQQYWQNPASAPVPGNENTDGALNCLQKENFRRDKYNRFIHGIISLSQHPEGNGTAEKYLYKECNCEECSKTCKMFDLLLENQIDGRTRRVRNNVRRCMAVVLSPWKYI